MANKVYDDSQLDVIYKTIEDWEVPLYQTIPYDPKIINADLKGVSPIDYDPDSKAIESIKSLYQKLKKLKVELFDL